MEFRNCEKRKLDRSDSRWMDPDRPPAKNPLVFETFVIPYKKSQGYLFAIESERDQEQIIYRYGLPFRKIIPHSVSIDELDKPLTKCCSSSKQAAMIDFPDGGLWRSPLHVVIDKMEMMEDIKEFMSSLKVTFSFDLDEPEVIAENWRCIGYLGSRARAFGGTAIDVWEISKKSGERETLLLVRKGDRLNYAGMEAVRNKYMDFQNTLTSLFYSQKVQDVIGGFEL